MSQSEVAGFLDGGADLLGGELDGFRITAVRQDGARRQQLDVIRAAVGEFADSLPHLPRAVGFAEAQILGQRDIGGKTGHGARAFAVDQARQHRHVREVDDIRAVRNEQVGQQRCRENGRSRAIFMP